MSTTAKEQKELERKIADVLEKTDKFIDDTEKTLDQFERDDQQWRRKGKNIGFDF